MSNFAGKGKKLKLMPNKEHKILTDFCRNLFFDYKDDHKQRSINSATNNRKNSIPDFVSPDGKSAIECETFGENKLKQLRRYNNEYEDIMIVLPLLSKVDVIAMYIARGK